VDFVPCIHHGKCTAEVCRCARADIPCKTYCGCARFAASATPGQAAAMAVESGRPKDLDWWVPPNHPTSMREGCHLFSIYPTFPDSEQVKEWNRRLARVPRQVVLPAGWLVDLLAILERKDWGRLDPVRRCLAKSTGAT